jgi:hypothetical protein
MAVDSDIDLDRVVFDPEYRREVMLRLNREGSTRDQSPPRNDNNRPVRLPLGRSTHNSTTSWRA